MKITSAMIVLFVGGFMVQYLLLPWITAGMIRNYVGKAYLSAITGMSMVLVEAVRKDVQYGTFSINLYMLCVAILAGCIYLYKSSQKEKDYLNQRWEQNAANIAISKAIIAKTDDYNVTKLAKESISQQTDEITVIRQLLERKSS